VIITAGRRESNSAGQRHGQDSRHAQLERFPPRPVPETWAATELDRGSVQALLLGPPFALGNPASQAGRRIGLIRVLDWLERQPGGTWQDRWVASGADTAGNAGWRPAGCTRPAADAATRGMTW